MKKPAKPEDNALWNEWCDFGERLLAHDRETFAKAFAAVARKFESLPAARTQPTIENWEHLGKQLTIRLPGLIKRWLRWAQHAPWNDGAGLVN